MMCSQNQYPLFRLVIPATFLVATATMSGALSLAQKTDDSKGGASLRERFQKEAPGGWRELEQTTYHLFASGEAVTELKNREGKVVSEESTHLESRRNGDWGRVDYFHEGSVPKSLCVGPKYAFTVARAAQEAPYSVHLLTSLRSNDANRIREEIRSENIRGFVEAPFNLYGLDLVKLVTDPSFRINSITAETVDGKKLVTISFELPHEDPFPVFNGGTIVLAPSMHWAIQRYNLSTPLGRYQGNVLYRTTKSSNPAIEKPVAFATPIPTKVVQEAHFGHYEKRKNPDKFTGWVETTTFTFDNYERKNIPAEMFTLTAFGLPEQQPGTSWWVWLLVGLGIVATALAFYFLRRSRSPAKAS